MRIRYWLVIGWGVLLATAAQTTAQVTYVDATKGPGGNTVRASNDSPDDWWALNSASQTDGRWNFRDTQGNVGIFESGGSSSTTQPEEDNAELKTTVTGLVNNTYDVYVFFRSESDASNGAGTPDDNWRIRAGFTSNPGLNQAYARVAESGILAGSRALPPALTALEFAPGTAPVEDNPQLLYYALLGQRTVTDGTLSVFIDDFHATLPDRLSKRTWYDGIGYSLPAPVLEINSATSGLASAAATWSNNQPPSSANNYNVLATHTVQLDQSFPGKKMVVKNGGVVNISATNADVKGLIIEQGATLTESVAGDFILGMPTFPTTPLGILELHNDVNFNVGAGETFVIGLSVVGEKDMNINTGAGATVRLADSEGHTGKIRFNGSGDLFTLEWNKDSQYVEMNSTGANRFEYLQQGQVDNGILVFNQPGTVAHATQITSPLSRLIAMDELEANAPVTVEVKATYVSGNNNTERRFEVAEDLRGSGNISVVGSDADPSVTASGVGMHEFELGAQGEPGTIEVDSYSGTLSATKFVNVELRHSLPAAKISVSQGARFEMGHDITASTKTLVFGEVEAGAGGVLEIGHEDTLASTTGHQVGHLRVTKSGGRSGNLSLNATSKTVVQVSGTAANQFDTAAVEGNISLGGNLEVWFNPDSTDTDPDPYVPVLNDTFVIMTLATPTLPGDFTHNNTVDGNDFSTWKTAYGETALADADGDADSDGADFLAWQRDFGKSVSLGTITGNFADVVSPTEAVGAWPAGLDFVTEVVGNEVRLRVTSLPTALGALVAVPEPTTTWLAALGVLGLIARRRHVST